MGWCRLMRTTCKTDPLKMFGVGSWSPRDGARCGIGRSWRRARGTHSPLQCRLPRVSCLLSSRAGYSLFVVLRFFCSEISFRLSKTFCSSRRRVDDGDASAAFLSTHLLLLRTSSPRRSRAFLFSSSSFQSRPRRPRPLRPPRPRWRFSSRLRPPRPAPQFLPRRPPPLRSRPHPARACARGAGGGGDGARAGVRALPQWSQQPPRTLFLRRRRKCRSKRNEAPLLPATVVFHCGLLVP
mmetsp:Transcript_9061/g.22175  ORF Transcript_9061/g.22175 Transcript_9061/m.22175 type:complete len:239 (-) Transcript_9061:837-1553(-)